MLRPIPISLMPDSMDVREPASGDYGGTYAEEAYTVVNVRFDANVPALETQYVMEEGARGIVFVDAANSLGAKEIPVGSLVTIRGDEMAVMNVHRFEDFAGHVHHWELEVR